MRYFRIIVGQTSTGREWTSHPNGVYDPNYWQVEFDILTVPAHEFAGASTISIYGVSQEDLLQAQTFWERPLAIHAGMVSGLPLAGHSHGLIAQGQIVQSFGNWVGTDERLDFVVYPGYTKSPLTLEWRAGQPLSQAINNAWAITYPNVPVTFSATDHVLPYDVVGSHKTLASFAIPIFHKTASLVPYGIQIVQRKDGFFVFDGTVPTTPIRIQIEDMIGQPIWIAPNRMQVHLVMRADIQVGDFIEMPKALQNYAGIVTTSPAATPSFMKYRSDFQGQFLVKSLRFLGDSRSDNGEVWSTVVEGVVI